MIDTKYQFFDDLSDGEYQSLKSSIETHGVLVPVEYDDAGNVLDGHHRLKACAELGITIWERLIRKGLSEADKKNHVRTLNIVRRQLTNEQRKKCWAEMRQDGMTLSAIAAADGTVSINTVKSAIDNSTLQNCKVEPTKVIGKDGKARPTKYATRQDGMTLSAIAAADGTVSKDTVQRAIDNSTFSNEKVDTPAKVIGKVQ